MHILKISDVYFPRVNGVSTSIRTFSREFIRRGERVTLIAPEYPSELEDEFPIFRVRSRYLAVDPEDRMMRGRDIKALLPVLATRNFDLVHIHTPFVAHYLGIWLARKLGLPVVETYHTYFEEYLDKYLPWLPRRLLRYAARRFARSQVRRVDTLVVPTQPMLDVLHGYGLRAPTAVIPTGIPNESFTSGNGARFRRLFDIDADRPLMLYVGRVAHEKNIEFLVDVTARVRQERPDALLVIAGEGPAREALRHRVDKLGLGAQVRFVGYLERDTGLADCYAAADLFVFASRTETQGLVLLEAMKLGVPVVTTAVMGTAEIMRDGKGGAVSGEDVADFAHHVLRLLAAPDLRARLSAEARVKAEAWSAPATAERMLELYRSLLGGVRASAA